MRNALKESIGYIIGRPNPKKWEEGFQVRFWGIIFKPRLKNRYELGEQRRAKDLRQKKKMCQDPKKEHTVVDLAALLRKYWHEINCFKVYKWLRFGIY